uniref:Uncharacterized protein n=3 Tax=Nicotiana TaxID=4085 RepID=A0A1S4AYK9_TOBAC|nr:PREDICTED: uncharacterized protein LOC104215937 [Nicotiana sylvestris]XP_016481639.1 PREDICTED: uncharacterized protein LOC107802625 [Nicotiana tabacum]
MRIDLADEKKAIEATVHYLLCFTTIGAGGVGLVYEHKYSLDRQNQTRLEIEKILQKHMQGISQRMEKSEQKINQIRHKYQEINQIRRGFPIINHVTDAMRADMELWSRQSTMKNMTDGS